MMNTTNALTGRHLFITGGAGFIGSAVIGRLIEHNQVTVFDNFARDSLSRKAFSRHPNLRIVHGDVLDAAAVKKAIRDADYVVHAAGIAGIDTVTRNPVRTMRVNMIGSANVLEAAASLGKCRRIVCFSSSEVFGPRAFRSGETASAVLGAVGEPRWTYAVSKLAEEHLAFAYFKEFGLPTVTVRPFNVYGPGQVGEGAVKAIVQQALANRPIDIHGNGTQIRAWCYVDDMVDAVLLCLTRNEAIGESFNIGNEQAVATIRGLAETVVRLLSSDSVIRFAERKTSDIDLRIPKVDKARSLLGFEARIDLEEGIRRTAEGYAAEAPGI